MNQCMEYRTKFSPVFKWHSNNGPFGDRKTFDHLNTRLVWNSDPHCIAFIHFLFQDKKIRFWDTRTSSTEPLTEIEMTGKVTSLDLSRNGIHLLSCVRDDTLRLIDLRSVRVVNSSKTLVSSLFSLGGCLFFTNPTCPPQGTQGSFLAYQTLANNSTSPCYSKKTC